MTSAFSNSSWIFFDVTLLSSNLLTRISLSKISLPASLTKFNIDVSKSLIYSLIVGMFRYIKNDMSDKDIIKLIKENLKLFCVFLHFARNFSAISFGIFAITYKSF